MFLSTGVLDNQFLMLIVPQNQHKQKKEEGFEKRVLYPTHLFCLDSTLFVLLL